MAGTQLTLALRGHPHCQDLSDMHVERQQSLGEPKFVAAQAKGFIASQSKGKLQTTKVAVTLTISCTCFRESLAQS